MIELRLPVPPSSNNAYRNVARVGRVRTAEAKAWEAQARLMIASRVRPLAPPYSLRIELPAKLRGDISNRIKLVEDLLVKVGIFTDDRHVSTLVVKRGLAPKGIALVTAATDYAGAAT